MMNDRMLTKPPFEYKPVFDAEKLRFTKLTQSYADGTKRTREAPVFDGKGGIEALLHCEEEFDEIVDYMEWDDEELFNNWRLMLSGSAVTKTVEMKMILMSV